MMKPAEARVGAKFARAIRFLLDQPGARRLLTQTNVGSVVMIVVNILVAELHLMFLVRSFPF